MTADVVVVTGGRALADRELVWDALDAADPRLVVVGDAAGADDLARRWCRKRGVDCLVGEALWLARGRAAGPRRNRLLMATARAMTETVGPRVAVLAFPGGDGTANAVKAARLAGLTVEFVGWDGPA